MEIVSYVGFNESAGSRILEDILYRIHSIADIFKNRDSHSGTAYDFSGINPVMTGRSAVRSEPLRLSLSKPDFSDFAFDIKGLFCALGRAPDFIIAKGRTILLASVAVLAIGGFVAAFSSGFSYIQTVPGNVVLQESYTSEMELLEKAMTSFALEESQEYDSDGNLVGEKQLSAAELEKLFRQPVSFQSYTVKSGDTISGIAKKFGLKNISTLISINDIDNVRALAAGQKLKVPSIDGLFYTVQRGNSLAGLSTKFNVSMEELLDVNELESSELAVGQRLFIPGAKMDSAKLQQAMGEMFRCPITAKFRISSRFGPRLDPFTGARSYHTGVDYACPMGTPITAAASGTIAFTGVSPVFGNYVIIRHSNGYQSLYGHMSQIIAKKGQYVSQGTRIGLVGSTGYSTGPHLHFTVYKNGKLVDPMSLVK